MSSVFEFVGESRAKPGKSSARAARRQGMVPAVIYGGSNAPQMFLMNHNDVVKHLSHEAVFSHILDVKVDGKNQKAVLKDIQRHPAKPRVLHMDFLRVSANEKIRMNVPLHFMNSEIAVGVKEGGIVMHNMVDLEIECFPADLPEYIEVDLQAVGIGDSVHISQLTIPAGVEVLAMSHGSDESSEDYDVAVASIVPPTVEVEPEAEEESEGVEISAEEGEREDKSEEPDEK